MDRGTRLATVRGVTKSWTQMTKKAKKAAVKKGAKVRILVYPSIFHSENTFQMQTVHLALSSVF